MKNTIRNYLQNWYFDGDELEFQINIYKVKKDDWNEEELYMTFPNMTNNEMFELLGKYSKIENAEIQRIKFKQDVKIKVRFDLYVEF